MSKELQTIFTAPFKGIDLNRIIGESLEKNDQAIFDINEQQLDRGLDMKGKSLGKYKNFKYKNRFQPVDLKLTGDWRKKRTLTAGKKDAEMFSQDFKQPFLEKRYGKDIDGVPKEQIPNLVEIIKTDVQELFNKEVLK